MNWKVFVSGLTLDEMNTVSNEIHNARKEYILANIKNYPPPDVDLIQMSKMEKHVDSIIEYRKRHPSISLVEAKTVMDVYRLR